MMMFRCEEDDVLPNPAGLPGPTHMYFNRRWQCFALAVKCNDMGVYTGPDVSEHLLLNQGECLHVPASDIIALPVPPPNCRISRSVARELEISLRQIVRPCLVSCNFMDPFILGRVWDIPQWESSVRAGWRQECDEMEVLHLCRRGLWVEQDISEEDLRGYLLDLPGDDAVSTQIWYWFQSMGRYPGY